MSPAPSYDSRCGIAIWHVCSVGTASWTEPVTFTCTIYRDAVRASDCDEKVSRHICRGRDVACRRQLQAVLSTSAVRGKHQLLTYAALQFYDVVIRGKVGSKKSFLGGQSEINVAQFAFRGPKEQPLNLSMPLLLNDYGDSKPTLCTAVLEATATARVIEVSLLPVTYHM